MRREFEWDQLKSVVNREKHGISLEEACALWDGPVLEVRSHYSQESRRLAIGRIAGRFWTAVFTWRGKKIRLISVRRSREKERKAYDEKENDCREP